MLVSSHPGKRFAIAILLSTSITLVACQSVKTTSGGTVGIDRNQMMSPLVSEQQLQAAKLQKIKAREEEISQLLRVHNTTKQQLIDQIFSV